MTCSYLISYIGSFSVYTSLDLNTIGRRRKRLFWTVKNIVFESLLLCIINTNSSTNRLNIIYICVCIKYNNRGMRKNPRGQPFLVYGGCPFCQSPIVQSKLVYTYYVLIYTYMCVNYITIPQALYRHA